MAKAGLFAVEENTGSIPANMQAAVYRGVNDVRMETVPVPQIGAGELLVRVHTCGVCGTDLKKIATGSHSAPRIFGHETSGVVAAVGAGVRDFQPGDRVVVFHHVPCGDCFYCRNKTFAQCETYKKVGCTAGFEPSGGGFAEYVRVMDWIVRKGTVRIPENVSFEQACFLEPVNTCMKGIERLALRAGETVLVIGQGPIGIMLSVLAKRALDKEAGRSSGGESVVASGSGDRQKCRDLEPTTEPVHCSNFRFVSPEAYNIYKLRLGEHYRRFALRRCKGGARADRRSWRRCRYFGSRGQRPDPDRHGRSPSRRPGFVVRTDCTG